MSAALLGSLPWFHRKFTLFAIGLLFVLVWQRWRGNSWSRTATFAAGALFSAPMLAFYVMSIAWWGTPLGPYSERVPLSWSAFAVGAPGLLFDRENGLLVWAPIYLSAGAAWWHTRLWSWPLLLPAAALFVPSASHDLWWGGFAPAARFLVPLVPLLACVIAGSIAGSKRLRMFQVLCLVQLVISCIGWQNPRMLWPKGEGHNAVLESIPLVGGWLNGALPSFRTGSAGWHAGVMGVLLLALLSGVLAVAMRPRLAGRAAVAPPRR